MTPRTRARLILKPGKEKSLLRRHPWLFSGAVERVEGATQSGSTVELRSHDGQFLGHAAYSARSRIVARVWDFDEHREIDADFFRNRLNAAIALRERLVPMGAEDAVRLVNAESDGLPGIVLDRYARTLVMQLSSAGADRKSVV